MIVLHLIFQYLTWNVFQRPSEVSEDGQVERTCYIPRWVANHYPNADAITFQVSIQIFVQNPSMLPWHLLSWQKYKKCHHHVPEANLNFPFAHFNIESHVSLLTCVCLLLTASIISENVVVFVKVMVQVVGKNDLGFCAKTLASG